MERLKTKLDAIGDVDFSRDGSQSSDSPLHANERSSLQISLPHRIRPPVFPSFGMEFSRLFQVLFRMNLMTVVICLCMNRPCQSYYYVPLVSFWYLIVYIVLAIPPKVSAAICDANSVAYLYIIVKLSSLLAAITCQRSLNYLRILKTP